jgi:hypothetical protein
VDEEDVYICPAGEKLAYHYTDEENGLVLCRYWTNACQSCAIKERAAPLARSEGSRDGSMKIYLRLLRSVSIKIRRRCASVATAEHAFATLKMRMGATHLVVKGLPKVAIDMALNVLAYNLTRAMNIMGIQPLMLPPDFISLDVGVSSIICNAATSVR